VTKYHLLVAKEPKVLPDGVNLGIFSAPRELDAHGGAENMPRFTPSGNTLGSFATSK
jgi:hypothetical protein